jgi:MFS family permease
MTLAQAGATLNQQGLGSLAPFFAAGLGLDHAALGTLYGAIYLGSALFTAPSGLLVDRYGERAIVVGSGLAMGAAVALGALVRSDPWLLGCLFVFGSLYAASSPAGGRAILRWFTANRGFAMGVRQAGAPLGGALGAVLLPLVAIYAGYRWALVVGGALCALTAVLAGIGYREPPAESDAPSRSPSLRVLLRGMLRFGTTRRPLAVNITAFLLGSGQYTAVAFVIVALLHAGASRALAGASLTIMMITGTIARPLWGVVSDRAFPQDRTIPLAILCALGAVSLAGLSVLQGAPVLAVVAIAIGLGASLIGFTGLLNTIFAELGGGEAAGSAMGVGLTFNYAAGFVTPPLFGLLVDRAGFAPAWRLLAIALVAGALLIFGVRKR